MLVGTLHVYCAAIGRQSRNSHKLLYQTRLECGFVISSCSTELMSDLLHCTDDNGDCE